MLNLAWFAWRFPDVGELDFHAYYFAGEAVVAGEDFVGWAVTDGAFISEKAYVYLPVTALLFAVYTVFPGWESAFLAQAIVLFTSMVLVGVITIRFIEAREIDLDHIDRWLILGACTLSFPAVMRLTQGNVDPVILLALAAGLVAIESHREYVGGVLWATIAVFKLFPALLGVWLLYRRAYRAIASAIAVGVGSIILSVAVYGIDTNLAFFEFILNERSRQGAFLGGLDPTLYWVTLRRPLSQLFLLDGHLLTLLATWLMIPFVAIIYLAADSRLDRLMAYFATLIALLVTIIPSTVGYVIYLLFPLVALLYIVEQRAAWVSFFLSFILINLPLFPQELEAGLVALPIPTVVATPIIEAGFALLSYGSIALLGMMFAFLGCLLYTVLPRVVDAVEAEQRDPSAFSTLGEAGDTILDRPALVLPFVGVLLVATVWELFDGMLADAIDDLGLVASLDPMVIVSAIELDVIRIVILLVGILLGFLFLIVTLLALGTVIAQTTSPDRQLLLAGGLERALARLPALLIVTVGALVLIPVGLGFFVLPGVFIAVVYGITIPAIVIDGRGPLDGTLVGIAAIRDDFPKWFILTSTGIIGLVGVSLLPWIGPILAIIGVLPILAIAHGLSYREHRSTMQAADGDSLAGDMG